MLRLHKKKLFFIFILLSVSGLGNGIFQKANDAYNQKKYAEAIALYEEMASKGYKKAIVYYNLGNAYFKHNQLAKALLWYERALRLDPSNEDIKHNIAFVNQQTIDNMEIQPDLFIKGWFYTVRDLFSVKLWSILSIVLVVISCLCVVLMIFLSFSHRRTSLFITAVIAFIFSIFSIVFANLQKNNILREDEAIVMEKIVTVKSMPDASGTNLFTIHEGMKVIITDEAGNWIEVRFPDGNKGWLTKDMVDVI